MELIAFKGTDSEEIPTASKFINFTLNSKVLYPDELPLGKVAANGLRSKGYTQF